MRKIDELLAAAPALTGITPEHLEFIAGCGRNEVYAEGEYLMREGRKADHFYVIRRGRVALETHIPERGAITLETIESGDLLGWSWLMPPYRVHFDARALEETHVVALDGECLRGKFDDDPLLGYEMLKRFLPVIVERLQATRVRMLDVYGPAVGA
jgi:CRP-like cAMP-binding protein